MLLESVETWEHFFLGHRVLRVLVITNFIPSIMIQSSKLQILIQNISIKQLLVIFLEGWKSKWS